MARGTRILFALTAIAGTGAVLASSGDAARWMVKAAEEIGRHPVVEASNEWLTGVGIDLDLTSLQATAGQWLTTAGSAFASARPEADRPTYRLDQIGRGDVLSTVAATGALAPVAIVQVGSEVSGQVKEIYADFNAEVRRGEALALIDPIAFEIAVEQAQADLDVARAAVSTQKAAIERMSAALETARFEHKAALANTEGARVRAEEAAAEARRKQALGQTASAAERERADAAYQAALAQLRSMEAIEGAKESLVQLAEAELRVAEWQLVNYEAVVRLKEAARRQVQLELERTVIRSPVDGVVILRNVEVGQTVGGTLYTIAQDLRKMQVNASIDESEIGRIEPGQRVEFTVDAFPSRRFTGTVEQIRKSPQTVQNVVTFTVVVNALNPDLLLLPGMTASARFVVAESTDVTKVPNAALRFRPLDVPVPAGSYVWIEEEGTLRPIPVRIGLTDGAQSEISGDGIEAGMRVVTGMERPRQEQSTAKRLIGIF